MKLEEEQSSKYVADLKFSQGKADLIQDNKTVDFKVLVPLKYFKVLVLLKYFKVLVGLRSQSNTRRRTLPGLQIARALKGLAFGSSFQKALGLF